MYHPGKNKWALTPNQKNVPGKDSCAGDSGGPLIARESISDPMYLVGIVSFGTKKCGKGLPGVYTNVTTYIPWILENLKP